MRKNTINVVPQPLLVYTVGDVEMGEMAYRGLQHIIPLLLAASRRLGLPVSVILQEELNLEVRESVGKKLVLEITGRFDWIDLNSCGPEFVEAVAQRLQKSRLLKKLAKKGKGAKQRAQSPADMCLDSIVDRESAAHLRKALAERKLSLEEFLRAAVWREIGGPVVK